MNRKSSICMVLICCFLILFSSFFYYTGEASSVSFTDVKESDWFYNDLMFLSKNGVIPAQWNNTFKSNENVRIDEFIKMALTAARYSIKDGEDYWAQPFINKAKELNFIRDGEFTSYTNQINRFEASRIINRMLGLEPPQSDNSERYIGLIKDFEQMPNDEVKKHALITFYNGIIMHLDDGTFKYDKNINRAEVCLIMARVINPERRVRIEFLSDKINAESKVYKSSDHFEKDYVEIEVIDNEEILVKGRTALDKEKWMLKIEGMDLPEETYNVHADGTYKETFALDKKWADWEYRITIYFKDKEDRTYWSYYNEIPLRNIDGEFFFPESAAYKENYFWRLENSYKKPEEYLNVNITNEDEKKEIEELARDIISGTTDDYEKLVKIHDWVADNIYYDWDAYLSGDYVRTDAYGTLKNKKSVCQGYAELTNELLKSAGIPSRLIIGYAIDFNSLEEDWYSIGQNQTNHAWNEAFVDGRWITLDTTWDSRNIYENGEFEKRKRRYSYFDPKLEVFSYTHRISREEGGDE
ncbi:transglutaminase domain-containing protein [Wukongibacter baidiensis]